MMEDYLYSAFIVACGMTTASVLSLLVSVACDEHSIEVFIGSTVGAWLVAVASVVFLIFRPKHGRLLG